MEKRVEEERMGQIEKGEIVLLSLTMSVIALSVNGLNCNENTDYYTG